MVMLHKALMAVGCIACLVFIAGAVVVKHQDTMREMQERAQYQAVYSDLVEHHGWRWNQDHTVPFPPAPGAPTKTAAQPKAVVVPSRPEHKRVECTRCGGTGVTYETAWHIEAKCIRCQGTGDENAYLIRGVER